MKRQEWIDLTRYCLDRLQHSAHDLTKERTVNQFLTELKTLMENMIKEMDS